MIDQDDQDDNDADDDDNENEDDDSVGTCHILLQTEVPLMPTLKGRRIHSRKTRKCQG